MKPATPGLGAERIPIVDLALILIGLALLWGVVPHGIFGDALVRFDALHDLIERGTISRMAYSMVEPLFAAPFYLIGKVVFSPDWWCARFNTIVLAAGMIAALALARPGAERRLVARWSLLLIAASMFPHHIRDFNNEVLTAVFVAVGLLAVCAGHEWAGWAAVIAGVINTPAGLPGLTLAAVVRAWDTRRWRHLVAVPVTAALILGESWVRRGSPWVTGYENNVGFRTIMPYSALPGFSYPLFFGLLSIVFSFGKGLIFFAPGLLLLVRRAPGVSPRLRAASTLWLWFLGGLILVYAKWWAWYGGFSWGPRLLLFASVPAAFALAARLQDPRGASPLRLGAVLLALALSAWVAINGALFAQQNLDVCVQNFYALEFACWYVPEFSVLWRPFITGASVRWLPSLFMVYCALVCVYLAWPVVAEMPRAISQSRDEVSPPERVISRV